MSLCHGVTKCLIDSITKEADTNLVFLRATYGISAAMGTIPLVISFYSNGEGKNFFVATAILCEAFALIASLSPICFGQFISQLQILKEGPLCSAVLGERKIRQNLAWAVKELTHVVDLRENFRNHFVNGMHAQGYLRIIVAISAIYTLFIMKPQKNRLYEENMFILVFSAMAFDFGVVYLLINPTFNTRFDSLFNSCLRLNGTSAK